jgi:hypothetical protein
MSFFRFFGFENVNFKITTERLGIAVFCAVLTIGSTFAPIIETPHVLLDGYPSDLSNSRGYMLFIEVLGIGLNLINLRKWATIMLGVTFFNLVLDCWYALSFTDSVNKSLAKDPTIHYTHHAGLAWGWWFIILGPSIMAFVIFRDYLRENP